MRRRAPSFRHLRSSSPQATRALAGSQANDTRCEVLLRLALWAMGLRYRKNVRALPGRPDVVFPTERVVVFCDGDFWHGHHWGARRRRLAAGANADYWVAKIRANMLRDRGHTAKLKKLGWTVLRFWESDILEHPTRIAGEATKVIVAKRYRAGKSRRSQA